MSDAHVERNLLTGLLAHQVHFIDRDALVRAVRVWASDKSQSLAEVLEEIGALSADTRPLLEALATKHLALHGDDPSRCLAAFASTMSFREELGQTLDPDVQAS